MKAAKQPKPAVHVPHAPDRQPAGVMQLRADDSDRQDMQREYLGRLQTGARDGDLPAQLRSGLETKRVDDNPTLKHGAGTKGQLPVLPVQLAKQNTKKTKKKGAKGITKNTVKSKAPRYRRYRTAYGTTTGTRNQGPHTVPHIGKVLAVENAYKVNPGFNVDNVNVRTGLIPSAGQARKLIRKVEKSTKTKISRMRKKQFDRDYKKLLKIKQTGNKQQRTLATLKLFELNPLGTYSLHQKASHSELKGKGERRTTVEPDLIKMSKMVKGGKVPKFSKVDNPKKPQHRKKHLEKLYRDIGGLYEGKDDQSDIELSSDEEYSDDED